MTPKRRYDATRRRAAAEERRARVVEVAAALFAEKGWAATTIAAVADEAGVSVELVSSAFGGKAGLFMAAFRHRTLGGRTLTEAFADLDLAEQPDLEVRLDQFVGFACHTLERIAPLVSVLSLAADQDADLRRLLEGAAGRQAETIHATARLLAPGEVPQHAIDELIVATRSEVFLAFRELGWTRDQYATWLRGRTLALLVPDR